VGARNERIKVMASSDKANQPDIRIRQKNFIAPSLKKQLPQRDSNDENEVMSPAREPREGQIAMSPQ